MKQVYAIAGVSKQAHHQYQLAEGNREILVASLIPKVDLIRRGHPGCGLEKLYWIIQPEGLGRDKFISTFQELGYRIKKQKNYHRTTIPTHIKFPNLITGMLLDGKNQLWQSDITYIYVSGVFYYLTFIIDAYSKVIKGYNVSDHMRAEANIEALKMALKCSINPVKGLIHHSDRGSQYVDKTYQGLLIENGVHISMGMQAQDNAYAERINGTIKNEYLKYRTIKDYAGLKKRVKKEVEHYNEKRPHNHLPNRVSPKQFEKELVNLDDQGRPTVIVYSEGNYKIKGAFSPNDFKPRTGPQVPVCPIVNN
jgi:hypothetical protein